MTKNIPAWSVLLFAVFGGLFGKDADVQLQGIVVTGENPVAAITLADGSWKWCSVGDLIGEYKVLKIRADTSEAVVVDGAKNIMTLPLQRGVIKEITVPAGNTRLISPAELDWAWIRSDNNFMRKRPEPLPAWAVQAWINGDEKFRIEMRNLYRAHGWDITRVEVSPNGRERQSISPLKDPSIPAPSKEDRRKNAAPAVNRLQ